MRSEDQLSRLLNELCALVLAILHTPQLAIPDAGSGLPPPSQLRRPRPASVRRQPQVSPAGFASLLLGASLALMLCGSVTFLIGFILMPWVLGLFMLFHFFGVLSNLSGLWRAVLCPAPAAPSAARTSPKEISGFML